MSLRGVRVLLLIDTDDLAALLDYQLVKRGAMVSRLAAGDALGGSSRTQRPDLVIIEYSEADDRCGEPCRTLRRDEVLSEVPCIVLTTAEKEQRQLCEETGATACLPMPFSLRMLLDCIAGVTAPPETPPNDQAR